MAAILKRIIVSFWNVDTVKLIARQTCIVNLIVIYFSSTEFGFPFVKNHTLHERYAKQNGTIKKVIIYIYIYYLLVINPKMSSQSRFLSHPVSSY